MGDPKQGIVHIIGPEQGLTQPGMTVVCGDSHTSTHGAFAALAFGIGTSEVEHVLATQTLPQLRPGTMAVSVEGDLPRGVTAKDVILAIIGARHGAPWSVIVPRSPPVVVLEGRMPCKHGVEAGREPVVGPDETTLPISRLEHADGRGMGAGTRRMRSLTTRRAGSTRRSPRAAQLRPTCPGERTVAGRPSRRRS